MTLCEYRCAEGHKEFIEWPDDSKKPPVNKPCPFCNCSMSLLHQTPPKGG